MVERTAKSTTTKRRSPRAQDDAQSQSAAEDREDIHHGDPSDQDGFEPGARHRSSVHEGQDQNSSEDQFDDDLDGTDWRPPSALEAPPPRPGYVQRWIRASIQGNQDTKNVSSRFKEGWRPRDPSSVPKGYHPPTIAHGQFQGYIGVEGMILCEMPEKRNRQRQEYYRNKTNNQQRAIDNDLFKVGRGNIRNDSENRVTRGRRPQPAVAADDE